MRWVHGFLFFTFLIVSCSQDSKYGYGIEPIEFSEYQSYIQEKPSFELIDLTEVLAYEQLDIRYATPNNFTGKVIYPFPACYALRPVAEALKQVEDSLYSLGLGILLHDGYRPYGATVLFYEIYRDTNYVASPYSGSRHNRGCAIDLSLYDLETGDEILMPTPYDDFTEDAHQSTVSQNRQAEENKIVLREIMNAFGFDAYPYEWWHFDYRGWEDCPILDVAFEELAKSPGGDE